MADTRSTFYEYVTWYSWATKNLVRDRVLCHVAAGAASQVQAAGGEPAAALAAALDAVGDEATIRRTRDTYGYRHLYVEWFVWAAANWGLCDACCHAVAQTALRSMTPAGAEAAEPPGKAPLLERPGHAWSRT